MRQLVLYQVDAFVEHFVQDDLGGRSAPVRRHHHLAVVNAAQGGVDRVLAYARTVVRRLGNTYLPAGPPARSAR